MPMKFEPKYIITAKVMSCLMRIEAAKEKVLHLPLTPTVLSSLRETARLYTTHYSTMIEGNRLNPNQIEVILKHEGHFPGRQRDEYEVKGYYAALTQVEKSAAQAVKVTERMIKKLHALVMSEGRTNIKPTEYRDGQNVIRDSRTKEIVYMPPQAKDTPVLMHSMVSWINSAKLPCPLVAAIAHYQFATIHPYYDGNGRTARLLTTLILHLGGYDLKGLYSLEEYYARNLDAYYEAISIGESHNYYMGRAESDITRWLEYFVGGVAVSFENVLKNMA
jgi:Fic family protein